jgi:hypothetical protein
VHIVSPPDGHGACAEPRRVHGSGIDVRRPLTPRRQEEIPGPHSAKQELERAHLVARGDGRVSIVSLDPQGAAVHFDVLDG